MTADLSFESKLNRAEQHLYELGPIIQQWIRSHRITDELDLDSATTLYGVKFSSLRHRSFLN